MSTRVFVTLVGVLMGCVSVLRRLHVPDVHCEVIDQRSEDPVSRWTAVTWEPKVMGMVYKRSLLLPRPVVPLTEA